MWHQLTFEAAAQRSLRIGAALLALGASATRPLLILSGNGIDHALMMLGAMRAGIPVAPVPSRAVLAPADRFARLRAFARIVRPGVVYARDGAAYAAAVREVLFDAVYVCASEPPPGVRSVDFEGLRLHAPLASPVPIESETVAKIMFSSDARGEPRGVATTHGMLVAMLEGIAQAWPFLDDHPPTIVDWLPWNRALGGNVVLGIVLRHAGTLYVDDGAPTPERFERSVRLRTLIPPTLAFDVPLGWAAWVERMRGDDPLRRRWLSHLDRACWSGAAMAPATRDALRAIGVPLAAGWDVTEAAGTVALTTGTDPKYNALGAPLAGAELKLVPSGDAYEARVRGPQVISGYWWRPDLSAAAFDEEGFYRSGDLVRPIDARAPERGVAFAGRLDERFKVGAGTWARAGTLRERFLAECSDAADAIVTGDARAELGLLVRPTPDGLRLDRDVLRAQIADAMRRASLGEGVASRLRRALIVEDVSPARHEALVARLHASEPDAEVIVV